MIKRYKIKKFRRINRGFTLVEALVAISIFTLSILALMAVLSQGISDTNYAKTKITGSYLAQEGIEYVRNMRDTFVLFDPTDAQTGWDAFKVKMAPCDATTDNSKSCYYDDRSLDYANHSQLTWKNNLIITACGSLCPSLLYDQTTGKYGYTSGSNSGFIRKIVINQISANEVKISSTVSWAQGSGSHNVVFSESLFNWVE